jgi:phage terminase large subunit-like protein
LSRQLDELTKSLVQQYTESLGKEEQAELIEALDILAADQKYNRFTNTFPDEGPYRRDLYKKQISFFKAGASFKERGFIAANRVGKCLSYRTLIELSDGTKEQAGILYDRRKPFEVMAWDGEQPVSAKVSDWIKKEPETIYRIWLENGEWFECAANHRVLCQDGSWRFVGTLLELLPNLPRTIEDIDRQAQFSDVLRWMQTLLSSPVCCQEGHHSYDEQLRPFEENDQEHFRLPNGVQPHTAVSLTADGQDNKYKDTYPPFFCRLSSLDDNIHASGQYSSSQAQEICTDAQQCLLSNQESCQFLYCSNLAHATLLALQGQFEFASLQSPSSASGVRIIAYSTIGCNDIYDFTVDTYHNYISHGVIHHNSEAGCYETVCHATGLYPDWWEGLRFNRPTLIWVGGDTAVTVRDIIQKKLVGEINDQGSGMLPKAVIHDTKTRRNVPEALELIYVKHITGGISTIVLKTYEQGRATWQGTEVDFIWVDEECPESVYGEALIRLMTTEGSIITTFTPLQGVTDLVLSFLDNSQDSEAKYPKWVEICTWDDVPHLTEEEKAKTLANTPPQLRDARSKGIPTVGSGLIYPVDPSLLIVDDFKVPMHFKRAYGMDVGWNSTAAVWMAWDQENDIRFVYSEHKQGMAEPVIHAKAIKARGLWIKGQIDPAARGRSQADGQSLFDMYKREGLKIVPANNAVETGIFDLYERMTTGRLKICRSCSGVLRELSLYIRDEKGNIVKKNDHLLDALRYLNNAPQSAWQYPQRPGQQPKVIDFKKHMNACI